MNYKKEDFYCIHNIQNQMKEVTEGLKNNFSSGDYIEVTGNPLTRMESSNNFRDWSLSLKRTY